LLIRGNTKVLAAATERAISCSPSFAHVFFESRRSSLAAPSFPNSSTVPYCALRASFTNARARLPVDLSTLPPFSPSVLRTRQRLPQPLQHSCFPSSHLTLHTFSFTILIQSAHLRLTDHRWPFDCPRLITRLIKSSILFDHPFTRPLRSFIHSLLLLAQRYCPSTLAVFLHHGAHNFHHLRTSHCALLVAFDRSCFLCRHVDSFFVDERAVVTVDTSLFSRHATRKLPFATPLCLPTPTPYTHFITIGLKENDALVFQTPSSSPLLYPLVAKTPRPFAWSCPISCKSHLFPTAATPWPLA
jgi:hypothetical protein